MALGYSYLGRIEIDPTMNNPVYVIPPKAQRPRLVSQTLIQDVIVLQVGTFQTGYRCTAEYWQRTWPQRRQQTTAVQQTRTPANAAAPTIPDVATLIVEPAGCGDAQLPDAVRREPESGLRSAGDTSAKNTEAVTLQFILDQYRIPNPAKLPYGLEPRMDNFPESSSTLPGSLQSDARLLPQGNNKS